MVNVFSFSRNIQSLIALFLVLLFFYALPIVFVYGNFYYQLYFCLFLLIGVHVFNKIRFCPVIKIKQIRVKWYIFLILIFLIRDYHIWRLSLPLFILLYESEVLKSFLKKVLSFVMISFIWFTGYSKFYLFTSLFYYIRSSFFLFVVLIVLLVYFVPDVISTKSMGLAEGKLLGLDAPEISDAILHMEREKLTYFHSFYAFLVNPVPRAIWHDKPMAESVLVSSYIHNVNVNNIFTNYGPGFIGLGWWNFGYLGFVFVPLLFSLLTKFILSLPVKNVFLISIFTWALLVRGDWLNAFVNLTLVLGFMKVFRID